MKRRLEQEKEMERNEEEKNQMLIQERIKNKALNNQIETLKDNFHQI